MGLIGLYRIMGDKRQVDLAGYILQVVLGTRVGQPPDKLYFDEQSGLLVRVVRYAESPLGLDPTQIDYSDYQDAGGVQTPFHSTVARPDGSSTIQWEQIQQNAPIDDAKFAKPTWSVAMPAPPLRWAALRPGAPASSAASADSVDNVSDVFFIRVAVDDIAMPTPGRLSIWNLQPKSEIL